MAVHPDTNVSPFYHKLSEFLKGQVAGLTYRGIRPLTATRKQKSADKYRRLERNSNPSGPIPRRGHSDGPIVCYVTLKPHLVNPSFYWFTKRPLFHHFPISNVLKTEKPLMQRSNPMGQRPWPVILHTLNASLSEENLKLFGYKI